MKKLSTLVVAVALMLGASVVSAQTVSYTNQIILNGTQGNIPDGDASGLAVPFPVVNAPVGTITKVRVKLNVTGTWNGDLYAYLVKGTKLSVLLNRPGRVATNNFGYGDAGMDVTFDDAAAGDVHVYRYALNGNHNTAVGQLTGDWMPDARAVDPTNVLDTTTRTADLSVFNGEQANGNWVLFFADLELGDVSKVVSVGLEITGNPVPEIITPPLAQAVEVGQPLTLTVVAQSSLGITYQWKKNGVDISGATTDSYQIPATRIADSGSYQVVVSNANGPAVATALVRIVDTKAPMVTAAPTSTLVDADYQGIDMMNQGTVLANYAALVTATDNNPDGTFTITQSPVPGTLLSHGVFPIIFTLTDSSNNVALATNILTVNGRPVAYGTIGPAMELTEDALANLPLNGFDFETPSANLTYTIVAWPTNGVLSGADTNGVVTNRPVVAIDYMPATNYFGEDSFSYVVDDGHATSAVAVVLLNITNVYDLPTAADVTSQIPQGFMSAITLVGNSPDHLSLSYGITQPLYGTVTVTNGVAYYTPTDGFNGTDTFTYTVTDSQGNTATGTIHVEVQFSPGVLPYAFTNEFTLPVGLAPKAIVTADFIKDAKLDLAVANQDASTITLLKGLGNGSFSNVFTIPVSNRPVALALGDMNYDRRADLLVLCAGDNVVQVFLNAGVTDPATALPLLGTIALAGHNPVAMVAADLNKDGYTDLAVVDAGDGTAPGTVEIFMHARTTALAFDLTNIITVGISPSAISAGTLATPVTKFKPYLVVANAGEDNVSVLRNDGFGLFSLATNISVGYKPVAVEVADLNGDKLPDIIVANADSDDLTVITNGANLNLVVAGTYGVPLSMPALGLQPSAMVLGNFVKNTALESLVDVAVTLTEPTEAVGHVAVFRGNGTNSLTGTVPVLQFYWFDPGAYFEVGTRPVALATADFNADRLPDLAVANMGSDDVSILLNNWMPKAYNMKLTLVEDFPTNVVLGGSFGPLDYIVTVWPTNGTLTPSNGAGYLSRTSSPVLLYTCFSNHYGRDLIKYYVTDGTKTSAVASITMTILAVNDPPVISNLVNGGVVEVLEDIPVKITNFINYAWVGPWGEEKQRLTYYMRVGNSNLFKGKAGLPLIYGTNTQLRFIPTNNAFGETMVELWAKDSGGVKTNKPDMRPFGEWNTTPTQTFTIRILNVNDAPKFLSTRQLPAKTIIEDRGTNWAFDVYDIDSPIESVNFTLISSNLNVLDPSVAGAMTWTKEPIAGSNAWRFVVNVTPKANANGIVPMTFRLDDGTNSSSFNVKLTVLAVNDQPDFVMNSTSTTVEALGPTATTATVPLVNLVASQALIGPADEQVLQKFTAFKVVVPPAQAGLFATPPTISSLNGMLTMKVKMATAPVSVDLTITAIDSGGVMNGGVNTSAPKTFTVNIVP